MVFPAILRLEFFVPTGRSTGAAEAIVYREMKGGRRESRPLRWLNWIQRALTGNDFMTANAGATHTHTHTDPPLTRVFNTHPRLTHSNPHANYHGRKRGPHTDAHMSDAHRK